MYLTKKVRYSITLLNVIVLKYLNTQDGVLYEKIVYLCKEHRIDVLLIE